MIMIVVVFVVIIIIIIIILKLGFVVALRGEKEGRKCFI